MILFVVIFAMRRFIRRGYIQLIIYYKLFLNSIIIAYRFDRICNIHELDVDLTNEAENKSEAIYCIDNFVLIANKSAY
jgi:hypothetical protein